MPNTTSLYLHFPWCVKKCPYCDFNSHPLKAGTEGPQDFERYRLALIDDWREQESGLHEQTVIETVFLGGGTPSLFSAESFASVLGQMPIAASAEITMEANPGTTEYVDFGTYREAGINRLSIGAQSFNDAHLHALGRIHKAAETKQAFANARQGGFDNINLDLMWGLPGQSVEDALADLAAALLLQPEHISWYQLTIEPKTEFAIRTPILPVDQHLADMEREGLAMLAAAGYNRYEVSAFSKPKHECKHNLNYWQFGDYVGVGAGAHGKIRLANGTSIRTAKHSQPRLYQRQATVTTSARIGADQLPVEYMMNALRLIEGTTWENFEQRTGLHRETVKPIWDKLVQEALTQQDMIATTPLGLRYLDSVVGRFLA